MSTAAAINTGALELWVERKGQGPDVLLIAGLGDPAEAWQFQLDGLADHHRLTAFDNRGTGRTPLPEGPLSVATMAEDAAELLRALEVPAAHVAGFSGGSIIAQELALRHPDLVRSLVLVSTWARPDAHLRSMVNAWRWMVEAAPSERAFLEAFFVWIYTARAHADANAQATVSIDRESVNELIEQLEEGGAGYAMVGGTQDGMVCVDYGRLLRGVELTPTEARDLSLKLDAAAARAESAKVGK